MADNFLSKTGLQYFYNRIKTVFATKTEIPSASDIQDVIDADKALTTTGSIATKGYVDQNGGKIDVIKVNGTTQTITNKEVDISVPTTTNDLINNSGFLTSVDIQGVAKMDADSDNSLYLFDDMGNRLVFEIGANLDLSMTVFGEEAGNITLITNAVNNLVNYYTKTETYTKTEVNNLIGSISSLNILIVQTLPTEDISTTTIYFVPRTTSETQNVYDEFIYVNNAWEKIGSTEIDLSNYWSKTELTAITTAEIDEIMGS